MKNKLYFIIIILYLLITGFIPVKQPYSNERDSFITVKSENKIKTNLILTNKKINGLQFLVTINLPTEFELILYQKNSDKKIILKKRIIPDNTRKYQTLRFIFDKPIILSENIFLEIIPDKQIKIWYGQKNSDKFFSINSEPVKGELYLDLIHELNLKKIIQNVKNKFYNNTVFKNFYFMLILLICAGIGWTYVKKK